MHAPKDEGMTPTPKPGILDIAPYVGGRAAMCRRGRIPSSCPPTNRALGPSPKARRGLRSGAPSDLELYPEGSAQILREAIGETYGLDAARIVCGNGSDELLTMLAERLSAPRRRSAVQRACLSRLSHRDARQQRGARRRCRRRICASMSMRCWRASRPRRGSSISPIPTIRPAPISPSDEVRRLHAGLAARHAAGDRRGLCRICPAQRLRGRHRDGGELPQCGDDAHLLQSLRTGGPARRLGLLSGVRRRCAQPHSRAVQRVAFPRSAPRPRRCRTAPMSKNPSRTTRNGAPG